MALARSASRRGTATAMIQLEQFMDIDDRILLPRSANGTLQARQLVWDDGSSRLPKVDRWSAWGRVYPALSYDPGPRVAPPERTYSYDCASQARLVELSTAIPCYPAMTYDTGERPVILLDSGKSC